MARYEHLPIYRAAFDLAVHIEKIVRNFSRYHKYGLGSELRAGARRALALVVRANGRPDKVPVLLELREECEALKVALRLGHDVQAFANFKSFEHAITLVVDIAKQNEGWLKSQRRGSGPNRRGPPPASPMQGEAIRRGPIGGPGPRASSPAMAGPGARVRTPRCGSKRRGKRRRPTPGRLRRTPTTTTTRGTSTSTMAT